MSEDIPSQPDSTSKPVEPTETPAETKPDTESALPPSPATPAQNKLAENPPVSPITPTPSPPIITPNIRALKSKAAEAVQARQKAKLEKIITLAKEKSSITNDEVEKLLHVSDATATRYLVELVKQGRLKRTGVRASSRYEPVIS